LQEPVIHIKTAPIQKSFGGGCGDDDGAVGGFGGV